jgi:hypothetical protein
MFDLLAVAMANDAMRAQRRRFEGATGQQPARSTSAPDRSRLGVAKRLRAVADRIEPVVDAQATPAAAEAIDQQDAA